MKKTNVVVSRGDVFWLSFDPAIGTEIQKTRPALIVSSDYNNADNPRVIVAPITSSTKKRGRSP